MTKYIYMKLLGLLMVILGFSYCLTSFYNFYDYLFGNLQIANANIYVMIIGLLFPLYTFIFGIYFYFYSDKYFSEINPFIFGSGVFLSIIGMTRLFISSGIMKFIHISFSYVLLCLGGLLIYGCKKYKY